MYIYRERDKPGYLFSIGRKLNLQWKLEIMDNKNNRIKIVLILLISY